MKKDSIDVNSLAHTKWDCKVSYSVCTEVQAKSILRR